MSLGPVYGLALVCGTYGAELTIDGHVTNGFFVLLAILFIPFVVGVVLKVGEFLPMRRPAVRKPKGMLLNGF